MIQRKTVLVTGAVGGIGSSIVKKLIGINYSVIATDSDEAGLVKLQDQLPALTIQECDLTNSADVVKLAKLCKKNNVSCYVHSAGYGGPFLSIDKFTHNDWQKVFKVNVESLFLLSKEILPPLVDKGWGRIVAISSIQGSLGSRGSAAYVASKHALNGLIKTIAIEYGQHGITANAICPGYIQSPMGADNARVDDYVKKVLQRTPSHKLGTAGGVADTVAFLLQESNDYMNGSLINFDGGISSDVGIVDAL